MKKRKFICEVLGFDDTWLVVGGIPIGGLLISMLLFNQRYMAGDWAFLALCLPVSLLYTAFFWVSLRFVYVRLRHRLPAPEQIGVRIFGAFIAFLATFFVSDLVLDPLLHSSIPNLHHEPFFLVKFVASLILASLVIAVYEAMAYYMLFNRTLREKTEIERHYVASQLEGLRNQVNPHFLFNSLNTLIYLIPEQPDKAVNFVQKLSKVYRYVLESRDEKTIPLGTELEFLQSYVYLLRERFGDNLQVGINLPSGDSRVAIVPLTLQMLFENAIKHNVISSERPLQIEVFRQNDHLVVRNNVQRKNQVMHSTGVGLDNIRARYQMLTQREVQVVTSDQHFTVLLPVIG
jgi:two-component system, LytTR family, sensor kinase